MLSAKISNTTRKAVYKRDGYACALCDGIRGLQIHHVIKRSQGGNNSMHNLVTLCHICHANAHGNLLDLCGMSQAEVEQSIVEYIADYYADTWQPWGE